MNKLITLANNIRVSIEYVPTFRSVACGIFAGVGAKDESEAENGYSHFIEHMLFKGTANRTQQEISSAFDSVGAQTNAFTSKMETCYYVVSLDEHIEYCFELLADMYAQADFPADEMEKERGVVLEEISMYCDDNEQVALEDMAAQVFRGSSISRAILGTAQNISACTRDMLMEYYHRHYTTGSTVVSFAGNITEEAAIELVNKYLSPYLPQSEFHDIGHEAVAETSAQEVYRFKTIEQGNVAIGFPSASVYSHDKDATTLMSNLLGGGMSSRLFQILREQMGLAYSVYSYPSFYTENGVFTIYLGASPANMYEGVKAIGKILRDIRQKGVTEWELNTAREQDKVSFVLSQERSTALMVGNARFALYRNEPYDRNAVITQKNSITLDDMTKLSEIFDFEKVTIAYVGRKIKKNLLKALKEE